MTLQVYGKAIVNVYNQGKPYVEHTILAWCEDPRTGAEKLLRAHYLNEDRHYKASARAYADLETLPGWKWDETLDWWDDENPDRPKPALNEDGSPCGQ